MADEKEKEYNEHEYYWGGKKHKVRWRALTPEEENEHNNKIKTDYFSSLEASIRVNIDNFERDFETWNDAMGILDDMIEEFDLLFDEKRLPLSEIDKRENPFRLIFAQYFYSKKEIKLIRDIHLNVHRKGNDNYVPNLKINKGVRIFRYEYKETLVHFYEYLIKRRNELQGQTGVVDNKPKKQQTQRTAKEEIEIALNFISFMDGANPNNIRIMESEEFERLKGYVTTLIKDQKLPDNIQPFDALNISAGHIRYTFYRIHKKLYGIKPRKTYFIDFLKKTFRQFDSSARETVSTKFSQKPNSYDNDVKR